MLLRTGGASLLALGVFSLAVGQTASPKKVLDHSVYDAWRSVRGTAISDDGRWIAYALVPQEGDATLEIKSPDGATTISVPRVASFRFTADSRYLVGTQAPEFLAAREARRKKAKPEDQPKSNLVIVDLGAKSTKTVERVTSWSLPERNDGGWLLYRPEPPKESPKAEDKKSAEAKAGEKEEKKEDAKPKKKADHKPGQAYVLLNLATGKEERIENVASATWARERPVLALSLSTKDGAGDGVRRLTWENGAWRRQEIVTGLGRYDRLTLDRNGGRLAFTTDKDDYAAKRPARTLYVSDAGGLRKVEAPQNDRGWSVSEFGSLRFSQSGARLLYPVGPKPTEDPEIPDDEKVSVDVWAWTDDRLQPQQLLDQKEDREQTYDAVLLSSGRTVLLETPERPSVIVGDRGDARYGLATSDLPYRREASWGDDAADVSVVDVETGEARPVEKGLRGRAQLSNEGRYVVLIDGVKERLLTVDTATLARVEHQDKLPVLFDELDDHPDLRPPYGLEGWTKGDARVLVRDRYDVWAVDPSGRTRPQRITDGRPERVRSDRIDLDADNPAVDLGDVWWLRFDEDDKRAGFRHVVNGRVVAEMPLSPKSYAGFQKARNTDTFTFTRQDVREFPDVLATTVALAEPKKLSDANPQIKDYNWLDAELVQWTSGDGTPLQGILYKPEDFDASKKYPMIAYFYERNSDTLHAHRSPAPSASTVNIPLFTSQGYLVFVPDIPYKVGYPGESAVSAIVSGVNSLLPRGYIDPKRLGIQGQSWGGYQVAYLVTETDMFAAAGAGAPVSNMTSAYGGIRYGSGLVRQFQYEKGQSRIGGTPWNATLQYIENSPLFHLPKVRTPLLIMANDQDGAVPYTQGIELFTGLRRLNKPAWMLVYNGEDHNLVQRKNRKDLSVRLSQFFDHFLKGAPRPVWMEKGVPAVEKGRTMGTELVKPKE